MSTNQLTIAGEISEIFGIPIDDVTLIQEKYIHIANFIDQDDKFAKLTSIASLAAEHAHSEFGYFEAFKTISAMWSLYGYLLKEKELRD